MGDGTLNGLMKVFVGWVCAGALAGGALGQGSTGSSFPIRALSEPVWPESFDDPLAEAWSYELGTMERIGDLNGDGVDDLVVLITSESNRLPVDRLMWMSLGEMKADGSKSFGPLTRIEGFELGGDYISDFAVHDHNGDGLDDLLIVTDRQNHINAWLSNGNGFVFGSTLEPELNGFLYGQRLLILDVDLDGDTDYVVYNSRGLDTGVWERQSDGVSFEYEGVQSVVQDELHRMGLTDFDGDGDLDMLGLDPSYDELTVLEMTDDGWATDVQYVLMYGSQNFRFQDFSCFADVNGDGLLDIVAKGQADLDEDSAWALGFFLAPFVIDDEQVVPLALIPDFENDYSYEFRSYEFGVQDFLRSAGDLDGDGTDELLLYPFDGKTSGWRITDPMNHNGRFGISNELSVHGEGATQMEWDPQPDDFVYRDAFSDINGDGVKDKIVVTAAQRPEVLEVDSDEKLPGIMIWGVLGNPFMPRVVLDEQDSIMLRSDPNHLLAVDLDGDGDPEVLNTTDDRIKIVDRNDEGNFVDNRFARFTGFASGFRSVVAQMDADSRPDVLSLSLDSFYFAPAVFVNPVPAPFDELIINTALDFDYELSEILSSLMIQFDSQDNSFAVGDVDGDGINDIVIRGIAIDADGYRGDTVLSWIGDGAGGLSFGALSDIPGLGYYLTFGMELIDFNQDGLMDVVAVSGEESSEGYRLQVMVNEGGGSFVPASSVALDETFAQMDPYWITCEDLDGDGQEDVMVLLQDQNDLHQIAIVYGTESGLADEAVYVYGGNAAEMLAVDLDGNGLLDLLTCSYQSDNGGLLKNSVSIMFQNSAREFGPIVSINDLDIAAVNVVDLNGDGGIDLIAGANSNSGGIDRVMRVFYSVPEVCEADLNLDGRLDYFDVSLFVKLLGEQRAIVDLDRDGEWNFVDVDMFLSVYSAGCGL